VPSEFLRRLPWLSANLVGGLLCARLANVFQVDLARAVSLAIFIPVVLNLAESVSSQSVSLALDLLRSAPLNATSVGRALRREAATGALLGLTCGAVVALIALFWLGQAPVAVALAGGIALGVTLSALLGLAMPVALRRMGFDPTVAAGPIALAAADVATLLAYLGLAHWALDRF